MRMSRRIALASGWGGEETISPVFSENSWAMIALACQTDTVPDTWAVGDQNTMTIGGTDYLIDIIGKNHDTYASGGTAPLTFQLHDCYATTYPIGSNNTNWEYQDINWSTLPTILSLLPSEVSNAIRTVKKATGYRGGQSSITTYNEGLFFLAAIEVSGSAGNSVSGEGSQYEYYSQGGSRKKYRGTAASDWWLRSANRLSSANAILYVSSNGSIGVSSASNEKGLSFAFCF